MAVDNVARGIASKALHTATQAGSGDMLSSDYDSNNAIKNAGGMSEFVHNHIDNIKNFVISLTEDATIQTYTTTTTYDQIKSAYENGREVLVNIDNQAVLPLMSAEFYGTTGSFMFGYTQVQNGGAMVNTRAISYYHTDTEDVWSDVDESCEPLLLVGGDPIQVSVLTPTEASHATTKEYVDGKLAEKLTIVPTNEGLLKAYIQNGSKVDVCLISNSGLSNSLARYDGSGRLIVNATPSADNHLVNKKYVDSAISSVNTTVSTLDNDKLSKTGGVISGNLQVGGTLTVTGSLATLGTPTNGVDVTTKNYVDTQISNSVSDTLRKESIAVSDNSSVEVKLSNGVYLLTVSDNAHGGLVYVAVYPDGMNIIGVVSVNGWKCEKLIASDGIKLTNITSTDMTVYLTSIGEGSYR